jgi:hypothetical protein
MPYVVSHLYSVISPHPIGPFLSETELIFYTGTFSGEIQDLLFARSSIHTLAYLSPVYSLATPPLGHVHLGHYLANRARWPRDAQHRIPDYLNELVDFLLQNSATHQSLGREKSLEMVCQHVAKRLNTNIIRLLKFGEFPRERVSLGNQDKVAMAMALNDHDLLRSTVARFTSEARTSSFTFGNILGIATETAPLPIVSFLLEELDKSPPPAHLHIGLYDVLAEKSVHTCLNGTIRANREEVFTALFSYHQSHFGPPTKKRYQIWLEAAIQNGHADMLGKVLDLVITSRRRVPLEIFKLACLREDETLAATLLVKGRMLSVQKLTNDYPLKIAAAFGKAPVVRAVVAAGADINGTQPVTPRRETPLAAAMLHPNWEVLQLLVDLGADLQGICLVDRNGSYTPLDLALERGLPLVYDFLREALMEKLGLEVPAYGEAKRLRDITTL